jgi:hypothetical protein
MILTSAAMEWNATAINYLAIGVSDLTGQIPGTYFNTQTNYDGTAWYQGAAMDQNYWNGLCYSPELDLFVAVADAANAGAPTKLVATTPASGVAWTPRSQANSGGYAISWTDVCWAPRLGIFCAVGSYGLSTAGGNYRVMTSSDGITWTSRNASSTARWSAVCWSPQLNLFVAVAIGSLTVGAPTTNAVMTSPDGISWTTRTLPLASHLVDVCWARGIGKFVAISAASSNARNVWTSPDGINWTRAITLTGTTLAAVAWSDTLNQLCIVGQDDTTVIPNIWTSADGITFTQQSSPASPYSPSGALDIMWSPGLGKWIASIFTSQGGMSGNSTKQIMTSLDGITWTIQNLPVFATVFGVPYSPNLRALATVV